MKKIVVALVAVVVVILVLVISFHSEANTFVELNENVALQAAQVESALQRRSDLIPNLVETVKGYTKHEEAVFTEIANARAKLKESIGTNNLEAVEEASAALEISIDRLTTMVAEDYPELNASQQFIGLQDELAGTENRINTARQDYNEAVREYNTAVRRFPGSIIANAMGYDPLSYFEAEESAKEAPVVSFE